MPRTTTAKENKFYAAGIGMQSKPVEPEDTIESTENTAEVISTDTVETKAEMTVIPNGNNIDVKITPGSDETNQADKSRNEPSVAPVPDASNGGNQTKTPKQPKQPKKPKEDKGATLPKKDVHVWIDQATYDELVTCARIVGCTTVTKYVNEIIKADIKKNKKLISDIMDLKMPKKKTKAADSTEQEEDTEQSTEE